MCRPYARIADVLSVNVGLELLEIVPGRVSTEVDAHLLYDTQKTVDTVRLPDPGEFILSVEHSQTPCSSHTGGDFVIEVE